MDNIIDILTDKDAFLDFLNATDAEKDFVDELAAMPLPRYSDADFMTMLANKNIAWIYALLYAFNNAMYRNYDNRERLRLIINMYIRIEEFILEDERFMNIFSEEKRSTSYFRAEQSYRNLILRREALDMLENGSAKTFIEDLLAKTENPNLKIYALEERINTFSYIFLHDPDNLTTNLKTYLKLFKYFSEHGNYPNILQFWLNCINTLQREESAWADKAIFAGELLPEMRRRIEGLVGIIGAELLIFDKFDRPFNLRHRIAFYRYLYVLDERHPAPLRNLMLNTFLYRNSRPLEYTWDELIDMPLERFSEKISYFSENISERKESFIYEGKGIIDLAERRLHFKPYDNPLQKQRSFKFATFMDDAIKITSASKPAVDITKCTDITTLNECWEMLFKDFVDKQIIEKHNIKELPPIGANVKIKITEANDAYPSLAFAVVDDDNYGGNGAIHVSRISRIKLNSVAGIFKEGDIMTANVIDIRDGKLSFSVLNEVEKSIVARFHKDEFTYAKVIAMKDNFNMWVSEKGFPLYTDPDRDADYQLQQDDIYLLKIKSVNKLGYVKACIEEKAPDDYQINNEEAVADFVTYILLGREDADFVSKTNNSNLPKDYKMSPGYMLQLIYILDLFIDATKDYIMRFNMLCIAKLTAQIINNKFIEDYFTCRLRYLSEVSGYINNKIPNGNAITENDVLRYPKLARFADTLQLLALKDDEALDILYKRIKEKDSNLARMLSIIHLSGSYPELVKAAKTEVLAALSVEETVKETEEIVNFGLEGIDREFKTTVIFPAGSAHEADMDKQMTNILTAVCGFLNAEGGTIYVGVTDTGFPRGIELDLNYLHCNEDQYQLKIRGYIMRELGKDINGLISIDFKKYNDKTVCEIQVPAYDHIASFNGKVYQRQGNATQPLALPDVRLLKERRKNIFLAQKNQVADNNFVEPLISNKTESILDRKKNPAIKTSLLRKETAAKTIAFYSVLESGKYLLTNDFPYRDDVVLTLPIYYEYMSGSLLYVYENGFAHRVAVSTLLSKKRDYEYANALSDKSRLFFASFILPDDAVFIRIAYRGSEYFRILSQDNIKMSLDLSLKGTALYTIPFDKIVQVDVIDKAQANNLEKLRSELPTALGSTTTSMSVIKEALYLNNLFSGIS